MIRLAFADLRDGGRAWAGVVLVAFVAAVVGTLPATIFANAVKQTGLIQDALWSIGATITLFDAIAAIVVLSTTLSLLVSLRSPHYARWRLIGFSPTTLSRVVGTQLAVASAVGAALGAVAGMPFAPLVLKAAVAPSGGLRAAAFESSLMGAAGTALSVFLLMFVAGSAACRRASRTQPLTALRDGQISSVRRPWVRYGLGLLLLLLAFQMVHGIAQPGSSGGAAMYVPVLLISAIASAGPVLFPKATRAWTAVVPARLSASWYLARAAALHSATRSSSAVSALVVAIGVPAGFLTGMATLHSASPSSAGSEAGALAIIFGGPLALASIAGGLTMLMSSTVRTHEGALLRATGTRRSQILTIAAFESVIAVGTAAIVSSVAVTVAGVAIALVLHAHSSSASPQIDTKALIGCTAGCLALLMSLTVIPAYLGSKVHIRKTMAGA